MDRQEWLRGWQAELWHLHHRNRRRRIPSVAAVSGLSVGLLRDALWLRSDSWRRAFSGTAVLCLASLNIPCLLAILIALAMSGSWHAFSPYLREALECCLFEAPLVVFVALAISPRAHIEPGSSARSFYRLRRQLFFAAKSAQILVLASFLSAELGQTIHQSLPRIAYIAQLYSFLIISLVGLRWARWDQEQRCKQCLKSLATPARVGRPSHNLLEWNGTELTCRHGHGLLSVPEMETSWCRSSQWVDLDSGWSQPADI
jgi:hypothetical protein